jgi:hypothetical protein
MKLDDETLLTAYLDGELTENERLAVEEAVRTSPRLGVQLRELASVRGLVAGLSRPAIHFDLVDPVMSQIALRPTSWVASVLSKRFAIGSGLAAAAAFLVAVSVLFATRSHSQWPHASHPEIARAEPQPEPSRVPTPVPTHPRETDAQPRIVEQPPGAPQSAPILASAPDHDEIEADRERQQIIEHLGGPCHRIVVAVDELQRGASEVQALLRDTPRTAARYGRIAISNGHIVDPNEPGEAVVFVVMLDEHELAFLEQRLQEKLHLGLTAADFPAAATVTMLSDISQIDSLSGTPVARLVPAPRDFVERETALRADDQPALGNPRPASTGARDHALPKASAPRRNEETRREPASKPDLRMTVLVWVKAREAPSR